MLAHNVFFSLKDHSPAAQQKLVAACKQHLTGHPGTVFFACVTVSDLDREVNDRDFDVGLHVIFKDRASHDQYQTAERHLKFIEENRDTWAKVRVFDSDVETAS
ncbi:MAG: Dabb family protein [Planctomycetes bacterium]|nr:Dabb family protein [Planctomycetota bacterium]